MPPKKPMQDWTLAEAKEYCQSRGKCTACLLGYRGGMCRFEKQWPREWDMSTRYRWSRQDKEDARAIKRVFPGAKLITRLTDGQLCVGWGSLAVQIETCLLPSLRPNETVFLDEILNGGCNE